MLYALLILSAFAAWTTIYFVYLRPKLVEYKLTAGIYAKIDAFEDGLFGKVLLHVEGAKTAIAAFICSMIPIVGPMVDGLNGLNWAAVFPSEKAAVIGFIFTFMAAVLPMAMAITHVSGLTKAARTVPAGVDPSAPELPPEVATEPASVAVVPIYNPPVAPSAVIEAAPISMSTASAVAAESPTAPVVPVAPIAPVAPIKAA